MDLTKLFITVGIVIILLVLVIVGYVKAPPDEVYIISGLRKKIIVGKASIRIPFLERLDKLSLKMISIDVKTSRSVPTAEYINVNVDAAVKVKISSQPEFLKLAAENFLNQREDYIRDSVQDVLEGNMREIIGQMKLPDMVRDRKAFAAKVQENAVPDLEKMGLDLISFNVQNFSDDNNIINDLGIEHIAQIQKDAKIAKAKAEREVAEEESKAKKEANDARVKSETDISIKNNELEIKRSELKKLSDIKQAEADAAYRIQQEEQRKEIEKTTAEANIIKEENEIVIKEKEAVIQEKTLEATIIKTADANKYKKVKESEAELEERRLKAEAELTERRLKAEAERIEAETKKYAREQEAEGIRSIGLAEAEAIKAKGVAEAEGIDKKADAMQKYGEAAVLEMIVDKLPDITKNVAAPLERVDSITMYGEGNQTKLIKDIVNSSTQASQGIMKGLGIDLPSVMSGFLGGKAAVVGSGKTKPAEPSEDNEEYKQNKINVSIEKNEKK